MERFILIGSILVVLYVCIVLYLLLVAGGHSSKEGFSSFNRCRARGFTKEFCLETPIGAVGPGGCLCGDGRVGRFIPGFRGRCVC